MKIALGTAQFGLDYGISNTTGKVAEKDIIELLSFAGLNNVHFLDTAAAYGDSEKVIGRLTQHLASPFNIITKIPTLTQQTHSIIPLVEKSLSQLNRTSVDCLLFHDTDSLLNHAKKSLFIKEIEQLQQQGVIKQYGASLYHPQQWHKLKDLCAAQVLQVPMNALDQRFSDKLLLQEFHQHGIALHCRSVFLQGLLLMPTNQWSRYFLPYKKQLEAFHLLANKHNCSLLTLALAVLVHKVLNNNLAKQVIHQLVIGCCSAQQLAGIINALTQAHELKLNNDEVNALTSNDEALINPSKWQV